jgi:hypothetical protein
MGERIPPRSTVQRRGWQCEPVWGRTEEGRDSLQAARKSAFVTLLSWGHYPIGLSPVSYRDLQTLLLRLRDRGTLTLPTLRPRKLRSFGPTSGSYSEDSWLSFSYYSFLILSDCSSIHPLEWLERGGLGVLHSKQGPWPHFSCFFASLVCHEVVTGPCWRLWLGFESGL